MLCYNLITYRKQGDEATYHGARGICVLDYSYVLSYTLCRCLYQSIAHRGLKALWFSTTSTSGVCSKLFFSTGRLWRVNLSSLVYTYASEWAIPREFARHTSRVSLPLYDDFLQCSLLQYIPLHCRPPYLLMNTCFGRSMWHEHHIYFPTSMHDESVAPHQSRCGSLDAMWNIVSSRK